MLKLGLTRLAMIITQNEVVKLVEFFLRVGKGELKVRHLSRDVSKTLLFCVSFEESSHDLVEGTVSVGHEEIIGLRTQSGLEKGSRLSFGDFAGVIADFLCGHSNEWSKFGVAFVKFGREFGSDVSGECFEGVGVEAGSEMERS